MTGGREVSYRQTLWAKVILTAALLIFGLWLVSGLIPALLWAVIIAVAIDPLYLRVETRWPGNMGRVVCAGLFTLAVALIVAMPITIGITRAAHEAYDLAAWISTAQTNGIATPDWVYQLPFGGAALSGWWQANLATPEGAVQHLHQLGNSTMLAHSRLIGTNIIHRLVTFAFTLLALFFLLSNRTSIIRQFRIAGDRLLGPASERIGRQLILSVRGTVDGLVLVGIGEGVAMTIVYILLGVPHPLLLGALTAVAAMIPFGAALMMGVAALLLLAQGATGAAIAVIGAGLVIVGIADHFIRPVLIGSATRLPFLWVLIGILGGVESLGLLGLFVGPATMAILVMLWRDFITDAAEPASDL